VYIAAGHSDRDSGETRPARSGPKRPCLRTVPGPVVDDIDYNRCQGNAHAGRSNGTMHDRTQTGAGQQGPQSRPAFPVNQMLSARSTEAGTSEALWSSVTCTSFRAGYWDCAPGWWLRVRIMPNYILFICVSGVRASETKEVRFFPKQSPYIRQPPSLQ
jgi:hypothetical protein